MAGEKTVICYGDSNTYGFDPRMGCPERLPRTVRWTGLLDARPGLRIINEGMNGREIPHSAAAFAYLDRILERNAGADILFKLRKIGFRERFHIRIFPKKILRDDVDARVCALRG